MELTIEKIQSLCTENSFERGLRYFREGRVEKVDFYGTTVKAVVAGTHKYRVNIRLEDDFKAQCNCPYDGGSYCKHIVATLIALSKNYKEMNGKRKKEEDAINIILDSVSLEELKEFLRKQFKEDPKLKTHFKIYFADRGEEKSIQDYKKEINLLYKGAAGEYRFTKQGAAEVDSTQIRDLAERFIQKRNFREAAKIYQALSEVIAENMETVDDSDGYYSGEFYYAVEEFAKCLKEAGLKHEEKRGYIDYLFNRYLESDPDFFQDVYAQVLEQGCTSKEDLEYWKKLLEPHLPKTLPDRDKNYHEYCNAIGLLNMQAAILEGLGESGKEELYKILQKYYREDEDFFLSYLQLLEKDGKTDQAIKIAHEGLELFNHLTEEISELLNKLYESQHPEK
ncbi:MAG: SWIM zinc finger family protein [Candidatus Jordarchaeum sp.]|uniref:SWIM zinc finger family protein n=1 Tax=Candidatus Jordarchaeum sp. TaxID=2823881 RepID=UPI0040493C1A